MKQAIHTDKAPAAVGPYSQAVWAGNLLFLSGQIPLDPATGQMVSGSIEKQTRRVLENIQAVLTEAGLTMAEVMKTTVFIMDMADFPKVNAVYAEYFPEPYPARSCVAVAKLPKEALVEIEVVAGRA
jgi:2-iminobutanoate/2-iminopropanoate deaminase